MISSLSIYNFILIKESTLNLTNGFNCLVGPSGAGKSTVFKALAFLTQVRGGKEYIGSFDSYCQIELTVVNDDKTMTYTKIQTARNKTYRINDKEVSAHEFIQHITHTFIIVSPSASLPLFTANGFMDLLDQVDSSIEPLKQEYLQFFNQYNNYKTIIEQTTSSSLTPAQIQYYNDLLDMINACPIQTSEQEEEFRSYEKQYLSYQRKSENLYKFQNYTQQLNDLLDQYECYFDYFDQEAKDKLINAISTLKTLSSLVSIDTEMDMNYSIDQINSMLFKCSQLKRKLKVSSMEQVQALACSTKEALDNYEQSQATLDNCNYKINQLMPKLTRCAFQLHTHRSIIASKLKQQLYPILNQLGLKNFTLTIDFKECDYNANGNDVIDLSVNYNNRYYAIDNLSTGEKSRFILALYLCLNVPYQLIALDEMDSGISGENITQMAHLMKQLANKTQLLTITHHPIMASSATQLYYVDKNEHALTTITPCKNNDTINVIAMLSCANTNDNSIEHAKHLLKEYGQSNISCRFE